MSTLNVRLPNSLHDQLRELAHREGVSINQLVSTALAEKVSALLTAEQLEARAQRASRPRFEQALTKAGDEEPTPEDRAD